MGPTACADRFVALAGADNVRDLGGLPARDGARTRRGRLLRGELTPFLTEPDVELLVTDRGLRTVVDLRAATEVREAPGGWTERGVSTVHCPLPLGGAAPIPGLDVELVAVYLGFLERDPAPLLAALDVLLDPGRHPALVHCAAGKDRTGVVSAILLALLGVPRPVIAADFALTATRIDRVFDRLSASAFYRQRLAEVSDATRAAEPATILAFLAAVDERHGGLERWLTAHRIDAATLERFRAALLVLP